MIRIVRPAPIPAVLTGRGANQTTADNNAFDAHPRHYRDGRKTFELNSRIYGHTSVKKLLLDGQSGKCCYCERKILPSDFGDVEHFRPKGGVRSRSSSSLIRPGYYWLAYNWSNLLVSCGVCNTAWKMSHFPLSNERRRARFHGDAIGSETSVLVDPASEDPRDHIRYDGDSPYARTDRGQVTIEILGLRRGDLREVRKDLLDTLTLLRTAAIRFGPGDPDGAAAAARLAVLAQPSSEFSSMVTDFLAAPFVRPVQDVPPLGA
jgi:uncharacterized protein (TIGR02646 family)